MRLFLALAYLTLWLLPSGPAQAQMTLLGVSTAASTSSCSYPLPLGSNPVVVAYGLRKLRSAYAGNAITIRRTSDSATQAIGFAVNGCDFDQATASTFCNATTCFVTIWNDQSGNVSDSSQGTTASQPQLLFNQFNGATLPGVKFTPTQFMTVSGVATTADLSVLLVGTLHATAGNPTPFSIETTANQNMSIITNGTTSLICRRQGAFDGTFAPTPAVDTLFQLSCRIGAAISEIYINQVHGTDQTGAFSAGGTFPITLGAQTSAGGSALNGFNNETIVLSPGLSSGDRTTLSSNQKTYWGTP